MKTVEWKFRDASTQYPELKNYKNQRVLTPEHIYNDFKFLFQHRVNEIFVVFWLDAENKVMGYEKITEGILHASLAHPREVFRGAIVATSCFIIVAHNHPSGNLEPSKEDIELTKKLVEGGKILDISVHDHIIFTDDSFYSMSENRII